MGVLAWDKNDAGLKYVDLRGGSLPTTVAYRGVFCAAPHQFDRSRPSSPIKQIAFSLQITTLSFIFLIHK